MSHYGGERYRCERPILKGSVKLPFSFALPKYRPQYEVVVCVDLWNVTNQEVEKMKRAIKWFIEYRDYFAFVPLGIGTALLWLLAYAMGAN